MKITLILSSLFALAAASVAHSATLTVKVDDVRNANGVVRLGVYGSVDAWNGQAKPAAVEARDAAPGTLSFEFRDLAPGTYAVSVIHDENRNDSLDANLFGMPTEGYGFSNDPQVMRKATFEEAAFAVGEDDLVVELHLR
jgi:uncharacterized protein (DUF2141 family)